MIYLIPGCLFVCVAGFADLVCCFFVCLLLLLNLWFTDCFSLLLVWRLVQFGINLRTVWGVCYVDFVVVILIWICLV